MRCARSSRRSECRRSSRLPARLDEIGAATRRLELALDPAAPSPFTAALKGAQGTLDELLEEVVERLPRAARLVTIRHEGERRAPLRSRVESGGFFPFGGDPGGDPSRAARLRGDAVGERQGGTARAVRDAHAEHGRRAHRGGAEAGSADRLGRRAGRSRFATRCGFSSPRRSRSSARPARDSCASPSARRS